MNTKFPNKTTGTTRTHQVHVDLPVRVRPLDVLPLDESLYALLDDDGAGLEALRQLLNHLRNLVWHKKNRVYGKARYSQIRRYSQIQNGLARAVFYFEGGG